MTAKRKHIYWDTCVFLAWIKQEACWPEEVMNGIEQSIQECKAKRLVIITSTITMIEVLASNMSQAHKNAFVRAFSDPGLQLVDVDRRVAGKASVIREFYDTRLFNPDGSVKAGGSIMSMGDAIHLATALVYGTIVEFQTLDGVRRKGKGLLTYDGNVAGARLSIKMPKYVPPPEPLKGPVSTVGGVQPALFDENEPEGSVAIRNELSRLISVLRSAVAAGAFQEGSKVSMPKPEPPVPKTES